MLAIERSRDARIATVTLNRPEKRNALSASLVSELRHVMASLSSDESVRVIVLTGAGRVFSAGADLEALRTLRDATFEQNLEDSRLLAGLFLDIRSSPKPVIARINGHAIAGGCGLAAACDFSVSVEEARFGFTEVRIGFVPALVSVLLETRIRGNDMRELFLRGHLIGARQAQAIGLIGSVVPAAHLDEEVNRLAMEIGRNTSSEAVALTKQLLSTGLAADLEHAARVNAEARATRDCKAGIDAFLVRKNAPWVQDWDNDHTEPA